MAEAAEGGHHLVGDVEHVVALADLPGAAVIALRRHADAAGAENRLGDEAGDLVGAQFLDLVLQLLDQEVAELLHAHVVGAAVGVGVGDVVNEAGLEVEPALVALLAGDRRAEIGGAVIGLVARDDVLLVGLADVVEVEHDEAQGRIHRLRAAGAEEHLVQVARRELAQLFGQQGRRRRAQAPGRGIGHAHDLLVDGVGHLLAAVADLLAPHAGRRVEQAVAVGVVDVDALGALDDGALVLAHQAHQLPGMKEVVVLFLKLLGRGIVLQGHAATSND